MIEIANITRDNFDNSGLSNGYDVGTRMSDIETEILQLIKGVFAGIPNKPVKDLDKTGVRTELLSKMAKVETQAITLFQNARNDLFSSLNESISNGFEVGKKSAAQQTNTDASKAVLTDYARGQETVRIANGSLLKAESIAIMGATARVSAAIVLLTSGALSNSRETFRECYDRYVVPQFETGLPGKTTVDGKQISLVSYAETVVRESSQQALLLGESVSASEAGYPLVMISAHYACCPYCEPWQNAILVDDYFQDGKPDGVHELLSTAIHEGLFHPNCRHVKRIYIPGKTVPNNPPNYDPKKVAVNYELEQMQRKLEREIRNEKRVLTMSLSEDEQARASEAIRNKQAQLRGLVKFADDNGYKVYRQNWKEQIDFEKHVTLAYGVYPDSNSLTNATESGTIEIQRNQVTGRASAIHLMDADLNKRQQNVLSRLNKAGDTLVSTKNQIKTKDIAALTAKEGVEFSLFTKGNKRMIVRGTEFSTPVGEERLRQLAADGWKFSAHTHPGVGDNSMLASDGDIKVLYLFKQGQSVIYNSVGEFKQFYKD